MQDHFTHLRLEHENGTLIIIGLLPARLLLCRPALRRRPGIGYWYRLRDAGCNWRNRTRRGGLALYLSGYQSQEDANADKQYDVPLQECSRRHNNLLSDVVVPVIVCL
jgi:hypothetical protein